MPKVDSKLKEKPASSGAAKLLAPEDVRVGDGVTLAHETIQFLARDDPPPGEDRNRVLTARIIPDAAGRPLRVREVCLPFVLVRDARGRHETLDLRRQHLYRLDPAYAKRALGKLRDDQKRSARKA